MSKKKNKFSDIKIKIVPVIIVLIFVFLIGYFFSNFSYILYKQKNKDNFYLMNKVSDILDKEFLDTREDRTKKITDKEKMWGAISGMVRSYGDPHTNFLLPDETKDLEESVSGEFFGIGVEFEIINGYLTIVSAMPGTPASKAGLKAKDIIVKVDEQSAIKKTSKWAISKIRGKKGTVVKLTILRKGVEKEIVLDVKRDKINIPTVKTYVKNKTFVIKLFSFTEKSPELFLDALLKFRKSKKKNLIIDLRGNPGGHLFAAVYIAGLFLEKDLPVVTEEFNNNQKNILKSGKYHWSSKTIDIINSDIKIAVLVDGGSASASEILAGALRDYKKAILMGDNTFGKGTIQTVKEFPDGTILKYTIAKWILPSGRWITRKGIPVEIELPVSFDEFKKWSKVSLYSDKIDPQLNRAIIELEKIKTKKELEQKMLESEKERREKIKEERKQKIEKILNDKK